MANQKDIERELDILQAKQSLIHGRRFIEILNAQGLGEKANRLSKQSEFTKQRYQNKGINLDADIKTACQTTE